MAIVHTTMGDISFVLYEEQAPKTCQQFIDLVNEGFYTDRDIYGIEMGNVFTGSEDHGGIQGKTTAENGRGYEPETDPGPVAVHRCGVRLRGTGRSVRTHGAGGQPLLYGQ